MGTVKSSLLMASVIVGVSAWAGCSAGSDEMESSEGAATGTSACEIFDRQTGGKMDPKKFEALVKKGDPVAAKILNGDCPKTLTAVMGKLNKTDKEGCNIGEDGLGSFLISETAAFESKAEAARNGFRTVITRDCGNRGQQGLMFSGAAATGGFTETGVEMIGRAEGDGVFNYYELNRDGSYTFFGDSKDFVTSGYTCDAATGTCSSDNTKKGKPGTGSPKMCASCHVSGGLIMKELASPWLHWTAGFPNGSEEVVKKNKSVLGEQQPGENLELSAVRPSFDDYNTKRATWLAEKGAKEILRPIACTLDVNVDSGLFSGTIVASSQLGFGSLNLDDATYNKVKKSLKQRLAGVSGKDDTAFEFTYPRKGEIDENYAEKLIEAGILDDNLLAGILGVDFTRPVFSGARCAVVTGLRNTADADAALATWAKNPTKTNAGKARTEIKKILPAEVGGAKKADVEAKVTKFFEACNKRLDDAGTKEAAMKDILVFAATQRKNMKAMLGQNRERHEALIEDPGTMLVTDDVEDGKLERGKLGLALSPDTCELK